LLTEQTRDWEKGRRETVFEGVRRYTLAASAALVVALPPVLVYMPDIIAALYGNKYRPAADAARLLLLAGAIFVAIGWTKSLPVSIGRPGLRVLTHGIETIAFLPLLLAFGNEWGATGAAAAVLVSTAVFAVTWWVVLARVRGAP